MGSGVYTQARIKQFRRTNHLLGLKVPVDIQGPGGLIGYRLADEHRGCSAPPSACRLAAFSAGNLW